MGRTFGRAPILFLLAQLPEVSVNWIETAFRDQMESRQALAVFVLLPYFAIASALSVALTGLLASQTTPSLKVAFRRVGERLSTILGAALLSIIVVALGMAAYFLPGIFFMTLYMFTPLVAVLEEPRRSFGVLARSTNLTFSRPKVVFGFMAVFLAVGGVLFVAEPEFAKFTETRGYPAYWNLVFDTVFSFIFGIAVNLGIYEVYCWLQTSTAKTPIENQTVQGVTNT